MRKKSNFVFLVVSIVVLTALLFFVVLQYSWLTQLSSARSDKLQKTMMTNALQVRRVLNDELNILMGLLRTPVGGESTRIRLDEQIEFWKAHSAYPDLLERVYLYTFISPEDDGFTIDLLYTADDTALPDSLKGIHPIFQQVYAGDGDVGKLLQDNMMKENGILVNFLMTNASSSREISMLLVDIDMDEYIYRFAPALMETFLTDFPYRIFNDDELLYEYGADSWVETSDINMHINPYLLINKSFTIFTGNESLTPKNLSAYVPFLAGRSDFQRELDREVEEQRGGRVESGLRIEVFYEGGTNITTQVRREKNLNLILSLSIFSLLLIVVIVLYILYTRIGVLRRQEQDFVAAMSHELRTPITVIKSSSDNMAQGLIKDPDRVVRYGRVIKKEAGRLNRMVESILMYSGLQGTANRQFVVERCHLEQYLYEILTPLRELAADRRMEILVVNDFPAEIFSTDLTAFRMILENLVMNALNHGGKLSENTQDSGQVRILLESWVLKGLKVTVEDDGPGIPRKEQRHVFNPFFRGQDSMRRQTPGSGLGLHIVNRITRLLDGRLELESPYYKPVPILNQGCRFTVFLPEMEDLNNG